MQRLDVVKWGVGAAALCVAALCARDAQAGNAPVSGCQYFSVELSDGDSFRYTGTESDVTLLVDDITYTVQIDPCNLYQRCAFFSESEITSDFQDQDIGLDPNSPIINLSQIPSVTGVGPHGGDSISWSLVWSWRGNTVLAKGAYLCAEMVEAPDEGPQQVFDAVSHNVYGEFFDKLKLNWEFYRDDVFYTDPFSGGNAATSSVAHSQARTEAAGMALWAVPTSDARHYQTPQIVQQVGGNKVLFRSQTGSDFISYTVARAFVKGRVVIGTSGAPVESTDVTVTSGN